jgi:hypothetical protein
VDCAALIRVQKEIEALRAELWSLGLECDVLEEKLVPLRLARRGKEKAGYPAASWSSSLPISPYFWRSRAS